MRFVLFRPVSLCCVATDLTISGVGEVPRWQPDINSHIEFGSFVPAQVVLRSLEATASRS